MPSMLVVEDDDSIRDSLRLLLGDEGYEVMLAEGGFEALDLLRAQRAPTIVLFDYLMPNGSGLDLLRGVAASEPLQRQHAFICMAARPSSRLPDELRELMDQLGAAFIAKPFTLEEVLAAVDEARQRLTGTTNTSQGTHGTRPAE